MKYNAMDIARYIIDYCSNLSNPISNLKLQKILYFLWVDYYKLTGKELFSDEICAWQLGPVVPDVYYEYSQYAGNPIYLFYQTNINDEDRALLSSIINNYIDFPASKLVDMTHKKDTPWFAIYKNGEGNRCPIPFYLIKASVCR